MTPTQADIWLGAAVIAMGLLAGLVYAFSVAVMPGLTAADDRTLVDAMQQMADKTAGLLPDLPRCSGARRGRPRSGASLRLGRGPQRWIVIGLALYAVTVVVTFAIHIPLNEELKDAGDPARIEDLAAVRDDFATPWVAWNIVRTLASTAAFGCLAWALVLRGRYCGEGKIDSVRPVRSSSSRSA